MSSRATTQANLAKKTRGGDYWAYALVCLLILVVVVPLAGEWNFRISALRAKGRVSRVEPGTRLRESKIDPGAKPGVDITYVFTDNEGLSITGKVWRAVGLPLLPPVGQEVAVEYYPSKPHRNRLADR